jgi:large subunit ribosomal protein L4
MNLSSFTKTGSESKEKVALNKFIFDMKPESHQLLKDSYVAYLANGRANLAVTKTRGLVSGGGIKPRPQKGSGRSRAGSIRSPIWRSGGITFGPTGLENYTQKTNKSAKRLALRQALSLSLDEKKIILMDDLALGGKTKDLTSIIKKIGAKGRILLVVDTKSEMNIRSTNNVQNLKLVSAKYLNVYDVMNADSLVITKPALEVVNVWLGEEK